MKGCPLTTDRSEDKWSDEENVDSDDDVGDEFIGQFGNLKFNLKSPGISSGHTKAPDRTWSHRQGWLGSERVG